MNATISSFSNRFPRVRLSTDFSDAIMISVSVISFYRGLRGLLADEVRCDAIKVTLTEFRRSLNSVNVTLIASFASFAAPVLLTDEVRCLIDAAGAFVVGDLGVHTQRPCAIYFAGGQM